MTEGWWTESEGGADIIMTAKLAVVLGSLLGSHNERGETGERLGHLQKLML